jgi:hypothetical protein
MGVKISGSEGVIRGYGGLPINAPIPATTTLYILSSSPNTNVTEGANATVRVSVDDVSESDFSFNYETVNGTATGGVDFTPITGNATIPAGSTFTDVNIATILRGGDNGTRSFTFIFTGALHSYANI